MADEKAAKKQPVDPNTILGIKASDAQAVLDYLTQRPFIEVHALVGKLLVLQPVMTVEVEDGGKA